MKSFRLSACILIASPFASVCAASTLDIANETLFVDGFQISGATGGTSIEIASHWGGPIYGADVQGNYAYIVNGRMFRILDISDEARPIEAGSLKLGSGTNHANPGLLYDVKVRGGYAFVGGDGDRFFNVIDVSNPAVPIRIRSFSHSSGSTSHVASKIAIHANRAYVLDRRADHTSHGLAIHIYNLTTPTEVAYVGDVDYAGPLQARSIAVGQSHLLIARDGEGSQFLQTYSLADPDSPVLAGTLDHFPQVLVRNLESSGDYAYAVTEIGGANGYHALIAIDISNPAAPLISSIREDSYSSAKVGAETRAAIDKGRLYLANGIDNSHHLGDSWSDDLGLQIFDIEQTPGSPFLLSSYRSHGTFGAVFKVTEERAYLWDKAEGFVVMDVEAPAMPRLLGRYHSPALPRRMAYDEPFLYVSDTYGGFTVLDLTDATRPRVVGNYLAKRHSDANIGAHGIAKAGDIVYLSAGSSGLLTVDVSDPTRPTTLGALRITETQVPSNPWCGARFWDLKKRDSVIVLGYEWLPCSQGASLALMIDVSDPHEPIDIGWFDLGEYMPVGGNENTIAMQGNNVFSIGRTYIYDVESPEAPVVLHGPVVGEEHEPWRVRSVAVRGTHRLLTLGPNSGANPPSPPQGLVQGLNLQDISNPEAPVNIGGFNPGSSAYAVAAPEGSTRVYLRSDRSLIVLNISESGQLQYLDQVPNLFYALGNHTQFAPGGLLVDETAGLVFDTDENRGLTIMTLEDTPR
jgi:hypothetical protein